MRRPIFVFLFLALSALTTAQSVAAPPSTIVFITSASDTRTDLELLETFRTRWMERDPQALILPCYLKPYLFPLTDEAGKLSIAAIAERLSGKSPTIIVAQGDPAFFLALELRNVRFPDSPIIAFDVVGKTERRMRFEDEKSLYVVGFPNTGEQNVELAVRLFPERKRVVILLSVGEALRMVDAIHRRYVELFPGITIVTVPNPSQESADSILRASPENTVVVGFTPGWVDRTGRYLTGKDFVRSVSDTYNLPVFDYLRSHLDGGTVGGVGLSPTYWGREVADRGLSLIFDGKEPERWIEGSRFTTVFADYRELKRFGSSQKLLPSGAELINLPPPPWIRYQDILQPLLAILILLLVVFILQSFSKHREGRLLLEANVRLEREVAERTRDLRFSNEELETTNANLTEAMQRTEAMQENVLRSAREITLGRFTAGMANGLNSPLNALRSANTAVRTVALDDEDGLAARLLSFDQDQRSLFIRYAPRTLSRSSYIEESTGSRPSELDHRLVGLFGEEGSLVAADLAEAGLSGLDDGELAAFIGEKGRGVAQALYRLSVLDRSTWIIDEAVDRAVETIQAVREYVSDSGVETETAAVDLRATIERALLIFKNRLSGSIVLRTHYEDVSPIRGTETVFVRIWASLLQNAIQAMPHGGRLEVSLQKDDGYALISVGDEGVGIDPSIADKIFEPFVTTRALAEGMGLGLAFCKKSVESAGGKIGFTRKERGTIFLVRFPLDGAR